MGCYGEAEVCKLIGIVLLYQLNDIIPKENLGLYRDDGLGIFENMSGPEIERKKKTPCKGTYNGLNITLNANAKVADFHDVHLGLDSGHLKAIQEA